ncbi:hypothetical protein MC7420_2431 [Coleofasciculus chthonoplastes PCC 7420]|uniref:Uncharacterized protein n=1 Tax=Coleofasciculus chthonoplastes PCC 7420 TaxID=118168 RepID=B4W291_9CYAN|nr:hypothetical protein MC7420_2431 [Coleofasciculus chthonoplastes PCC 7420]
MNCPLSLVFPLLECKSRYEADDRRTDQHGQKIDKKRPPPFQQGVGNHFHIRVTTMIKSIEQL